MAHFDPKIWAEIAPRFKQLTTVKNFEKFLAAHDLMGLKWRPIADGRQGMSVESLFNFCKAFDISPTWLLFGKGRMKLSSVEEPTAPTVAEIVRQTVAGMERLLEEQKPRPKQGIFDAVRRYGNNAARKTNVEDVSPVSDGAIKRRPASKAK